MTKHEFMHSTPHDINIRYKVYMEEKEAQIESMEYSAWLNGQYVLAAIGCAFSENAEYPENPLSKKAKKQESKNSGKSSADITEQKDSEEVLAQKRLWYTLRIQKFNARHDK